MFGIPGLVIGLFMGVMMFPITSMAGMAAMTQEQSGAGLMAGMGLLPIIVMPRMYGVFQFIAAAIQAFIYYIAARFVGGIEIDAA